MDSVSFENHGLIYAALPRQQLGRGPELLYEQHPEFEGVVGWQDWEEVDFQVPVVMPSSQGSASNLSESGFLTFRVFCKESVQEEIRSSSVLPPVFSSFRGACGMG